MPTKQVSYRNDKAVQVRVYVEKPRKKRSSSSSIIHHHHHEHLHYHVHHRVRQQEVGHHGSGNNKGYDRRAGLLMYSHHLRESAKGASSTPSLSKWVANYNPQPPPTQIAPSNKKKAQYEEKPTCFGIWKLLIPSFLRSRSKSQNKEKKKQMHGGVSGNGTKKLQVWKGKSFVTNVFSIRSKRA